MKRSYHISGMTCQGCRAGVEQDLKSVAGVSEAIVSLEKEEAVITMASLLSTAVLQKGLKSKYQISEKSPQHTKTPSVGIPIEPSKFKQLQPLILILSYITVTSILLHYKAWDSKAVMLDFMGLFYIVFSFFKLLDLKGFASSFAMYDPIAKRMTMYGWIYPFIEIVVGVFLLMRIAIPIALGVTLLILGMTTLGVVQVLRNKTTIQCACLGTVLKLPMTEATLIENLIMIIMALLMLFAY